MLRSFLRRHDWRFVAQPLGRRGACWTNSTGYRSSEDDAYTDDVDHSSYNKKRHLYLVLDDWKNGFSIHKLDLNKDDDGGVDLPLPAPVHRQEKQHVRRRDWEYERSRSQWNFAALGSKIIAAGALDTEEDGVTLAYDTATAALSAVPRLPATLLRCPWTLAAAVGNGLYVFEPNSERGSWCDVYSYRKRGDAVVGNGMHRLDAPGSGRQHWTWGSIPSNVPFSVSDIESSVVHPKEGGAGLFVSVGQWVHEHDERGGQTSVDGFTRTSETFSYEGAGQWRRHGEWDMPFWGQGNYDGELDAWVGLHKFHGPASKHSYAHQTDGYLCSSDVITSLEGSTTQPPAWKLCGEKLFGPCNDRHVGASLVYMGDSTYCLVEVKELEIFEERHVGNKSAIHLAIFSLKYDKNGKLTITKRRPPRSYLFSRFDDNHNNVRAFWL